jgi:hypothetical protein
MEWFSNVLEILSPPAGITDKGNHGPRKIGNPFHFDTFDWPRGLHFILSPLNLKILYSFEQSAPVSAFTCNLYI